MKRQQGFTLVEIIIVIVLLSAMMAGMTALFTTTIGNSHTPYLRQRALAVATAFMDEIQHKRWNESTPLGGGCVNTGVTCLTGPAATPIGADGGESRSNYDDIDDYDAITNQTPPQNSSGTNMPGYSGFTVSINISQPGAAWNGINAADVRHISVSVTSSANETVTLTSFRTNY